MELDVPLLNRDLLTRYRQRLDLTTLDLETALAVSAQKDQRIDELTARLASYEAERSARPKPGPPPAR